MTWPRKTSPPISTRAWTGFVGLLQQGVDLAAKERLIRRDFQVSEWVEPRFLDAALQQDQAVQAAR
jgi:sulfonate transport system substrate-binding protein